MPYVSNQLIEPRIYHTLTDGYDGYALVTGSTPLAYGAKLLGAIIENTTSSNLWAQVFDGYAQPSASAVPLLELQLGPTSQGSIDLGAMSCVPVSKGIVIAGSSTRGVYTAASGSMWLSAFWID